MTLNVIVGAADPAKWHMALAAGGTTFPLCTLPLPALDPPFSGPLSIPAFPSLGPVGFLSTLTTAEGIICHDFKTLDTGLSESPLTVESVRGLLESIRKE